MNTNKINQKIATLIILIMIALSSVACDIDNDVKNHRPVAGDSRTAEQMYNEASDNIETGVKGGVFNQVWTD